MSESTIRDQELQIFVVGCNNLKDKKWLKKQNPYVCLEYGQAKFQTGTCEGGGTTPAFQSQFNLRLMEGIKELNVSVWGRNTFFADDFIGSVRVDLQKVLSEGFDDRHWSLRSKSGKHSGEICLIMRHSARQQSATKRPYASAPSSPQWTNTPRPYASGYHSPPHPPSNYYRQGPSKGFYPPPYPY
ncbi:C2 domain [Dillenia turbinata]|uniref:C2 domain n=1 Tax=Dillenia turbinata TaxID=194707 RepID=A0AAN8VT63_9MAGN